MGGDELFEVKGGSAMKALVGQKGNLESWRHNSGCTAAAGCSCWGMGILMRSALQ